MSVLHLLFGIFGNITGMFLFLAPVYGLPFVSQHNLLVTTINGTGAALEAAYVAIFLFYAPRMVRSKIFGLLILVLTVFSIVALVSLFALHGHKRKALLWLCFCNIFHQHRLVVHTKSVEFMPFFLSLFVFFCGTSSFSFGLLRHDPFIEVPNGFGCGLGAIQLILYAIYRDKGKKKGKRDEGRANGTADANSIQLCSQSSQQQQTNNGNKDSYSLQPADSLA